MIDILLAAWNSEKFLSEQIDSIIAQSETDWRLLIRDGGSTDSTLQIIDHYCRQEPERIILVETGKATAVENFARLLHFSTGEAVMFADHDDVWLPDKIAASFAKLKEIESGTPPGAPVCVFTDAVVTDADLNQLHASNLKNQHLDPVRGVSLNRLLIQNVPSGNAMIFNAALRKLITPMPPETVMHDHYAVMAAAALGKIGFLPEATLLYRQHGCNVLGSGCYSLPGIIRKLASGRKVQREKIFSYADQAGALARELQDKLAPESLQMLQEFAGIRNAGWFGRRRILLRHGIAKTGFLRNLSVLLGV